MKVIGRMAFVVAIIATIIGSASFYKNIAQGANVGNTTPLFVDDINELRVSSGLAELRLDDSLTRVAEIRAKEAATKWSHERPNGHMGYELVPGNIWKGENLAYIEPKGLTAAQIEDESFRALLLSSSHLANMMFEYYTRVGIASYRAEDGVIYTAFIFAS